MPADGGDKDLPVPVVCATSAMATKPKHPRTVLLSSLNSFSGASVFEKFKSARRDPVTVAAVGAIVFAVLVIGGIAYFYNNRPSALVEATQNIRQIFQGTFR